MNIAALALLVAAGTDLVCSLCTEACAQSAAVARLKADDSAFNAQLQALENKMGRGRHETNDAAAVANKPVAQEQPDFGDKKIHIGGVTITPGGYLDLESRKRDP